MELFITDLDGTLLRKDKSISKYSIQTLNELIEKGHNISIATARSLSSAKTILEPLNLNLPIVLNNGGFIYDPVTNKNLVANYMSNEITKIIVEKSLAKGLNPFVHLESNSTNQLYYSGLFNHGEIDYYESRMKAKDKRFKEVKEYDLESKKIITVFFIGEEKELTSLYEYLKENFNSLQYHLFLDVYSNYYWLEINHLNATKKNGINFLKKHLKIDKVTCFGDNLNDISMFEVCEETYAVENAHVKLKEIAMGIIDSNENDGVAKFIESKVVR
jgi:Cof subfamily protein (haloacid dehalogenase superfamily)